MLEQLKASLVSQIGEGGGRHDEAAFYDGEPGDPGLAGGPDSMSWEINGDLASLVVGETGAIIMEVLHPSVMAGVFTQSSYRTEPLRRPGLRDRAATTQSQLRHPTLGSDVTRPAPVVACESWRR